MNYNQMKAMLDSLGVGYQECWDKKIEAPYLRIVPGMGNVLANKPGLALEICFDEHENFLDMIIWHWEE